MATQYTAGLTSGQILTAAIMNQLGAAWESWSPTITQSASVTRTVGYGKYMRIQKLVIAQTNLTVTGAGTGGNLVQISLPLTAADGSSQIIGSGYIYDVSTTTLYSVVVGGLGTTAAVFYYNNNTGDGFGVNPNIALANNDQIRATIMYEAA